MDMTRPIIHDMKRGKFVLNLRTINDDPESAKAIMAEVIVLKADFDLFMERIVYQAISRHFEQLNHGDIMPTYQFILHKDGAGNVTLEEVQKLGTTVGVVNW